MFNYKKYIKDGTQIYSYRDGILFHIYNDGTIYSIQDGVVARIMDNGQIYSYKDGIIAKIEDNGQIYSYKDGIIAKIEDNGQIYSYKDGIVAVIENLAYGFDADEVPQKPEPVNNTTTEPPGLGFWVFQVLIFVIFVSTGIEPITIIAGVIFLIFSFFYCFDPDYGIWDQIKGPIIILAVLYAIYIVGIVFNFLRSLKYIEPVLNLLILLCILCFVALIVGMIKPQLVVWWGDKEKINRKTVLKYYLTGLLASFILMIL